MLTLTHTGAEAGRGGTGYTKLCFRSFSSASAAQLTDGGVFSPPPLSLPVAAELFELDKELNRGGVT